MPVLDLFGWSHFLPPDGEAPAQTGRLVFQGGAPSVLLLQGDPAADLVLDQTIDLGGSRFDAGIAITVSGLAQGESGSFSVVSLGGAPVGLAARADALVPGQGVTMDSQGADSPPVTLPTDPFRGVLCFAAGTQLATPDGPRRVETLRPDMAVVTADNGEQPILWTGRREVLFNRSDDAQRPILVRADALGPGRPRRDLIVSPDHRLLLTGAHVESICGHAAVLVPAVALIGLRGVRPMLGKRRVTYVNVMLEHHAILEAEGAAAESFYPDRAALAALGDAQRASLFDARPALRSTPEEGVGAPARPFLDHEAGAALARRLKADWQALEKPPAFAAE